MNWEEAVDYICNNYEYAFYGKSCGEILCETEDQANEIADKVEELMEITDCHTNYYDPKDGMNDVLDGYWSVYID